MKPNEIWLLIKRLRVTKQWTGHVSLAIMFTITRPTYNNFNALQLIWQIRWSAFHGSFPEIDTRYACRMTNTMRTQRESHSQHKEMQYLTFKIDTIVCVHGWHIDTSRERLKQIIILTLRLDPPYNFITVYHSHALKIIKKIMKMIYHHRII